MKMKTALALALGVILSGHVTAAEQPEKIVVKIERLDPVKGNSAAGTVEITESATAWCLPRI